MTVTQKDYHQFPSHLKALPASRIQRVSQQQEEQGLCHQDFKDYHLQLLLHCHKLIREYYIETVNHDEDDDNTVEGIHNHWTTRGSSCSSSHSFIPEEAEWTEDETNPSKDFFYWTDTSSCFVHRRSSKAYSPFNIDCRQQTNHCFNCCKSSTRSKRTQKSSFFDWSR